MAKKKKQLGPKQRLTASNTDRHHLYELSVQNVETEIDFVDETFEKLRGRKAAKLREDFCGTGNTSSEWVSRRESNTAVGLDLDRPTLDWGLEHKVGPLTDEQKSRITLLERDVRTPGDAVEMDCVLAMNFSYWLFMTRDEMRAYFETVRESLVDDGVFFLDHYGGSEANEEQTEDRAIEDEYPGQGTQKFTYVWDQHKFNPINGRMQCRIHFKFPDGSKWQDAFTYEWRLWTIPELRELLLEAGFKSATVYWEGEDDEGEGNGEYEPTEEGSADPAYVSYLVATK